MFRGMANVVLGLVALFLASCASTTSDPEGAAQVSVTDLQTNPGLWDGRRVQVTGLAVAEFENWGLFQSWQDYCPGGAGKRAIYVKWDESVGSPQSRLRRVATMRGTFRNEIGVLREIDGEQYGVISIGAAGPGPLDDVEIVRWHGAQLARCQR